MRCVFLFILVATVVVSVNAKKCDKLRTWPECGECFSDNDCGVSRGTCFGVTNTTSGGCLCDEEYAGENCKYKRKIQWLAFLLSFLVGSYGVDRFYLELTTTAILKLLLTITSPCSCFITYPGVFIWWLYDVIVIGLGTLDDGNGYNMYEWSSVSLVLIVRNATFTN